MFDDCIYFNISALSRTISKIWQREFERLGLSPSHGYLLFAIVKSPGITQKELSELMELDASTITRFMDTLEQRSLIEKTSRGKGASFNVTEHGKKEYRKIKKAMDGLYTLMKDHFGEHNFADFVKNLHTARQSFAKTV